MATPGPHEVFAWIDDVDRLPNETDENNNVFTTWIVVPTDTIREVAVSVGTSVRAGQHMFFQAVIDGASVNDPTRSSSTRSASFYLDGEFLASSTSVFPQSLGDGVAVGVDSRYSHTDANGAALALNPSPFWTATQGHHTIEARVEGPVPNSKSITFEVGPAAALPGYDLVVTSVGPSGLTFANTPVRFAAVVRNYGTTATPAGVIHGLSFWIDGQPVSWSDTWIDSLAPGAWVQLTANSGPDSSLNGAWTATPGPHQLSAWIDDVNRLPDEADEHNNITTVSMSVPSDTILDVSVRSTSPLHAGESVSFTAFAKARAFSSELNMGSQHSVPVSFYLDGEFLSTCTGAFRIQQSWDAVLPLDSRYTHMSPTGPDGPTAPGGIWTATPGTHTIEARTGEGPGRSSKTLTFDVAANNSGAPDLVVDSIFVDSPPVVSDEVVFHATIRNTGTAPTPGGVIHGLSFWVDGQPVSWSDTWTNSLAPGATATLTARWGPFNKGTWTATMGAHTVKAWVDDVDRIPGEANENNNTAEIALVVSPPPIPTTNADLVLLDLYCVIEDNGGDTYRVPLRALVKNAGTDPIPAGPIQVRFFVNGQSVAWAAKSGPIAPGGSITISTDDPDSSGPWITTAGTFDVVAVADDANQIPERDETNNQRTRTFQIPAATSTDYFIQSLGPDRVPVAGQPFVLEAVLVDAYANPNQEPFNGTVSFTLAGRTVEGSVFLRNHIPGPITLRSDFLFPIHNPDGVFALNEGSYVLTAVFSRGTAFPDPPKNNSAQTTIYVAPANVPRLPDVVPTSIDTTYFGPPRTYYPGEAVTFTVRVDNIGTAALSAGTILGASFWIDGEPVSWSDTVDGGVSIGGSVALTANFGPTGSAQWIATAGSHLLEVIVDDINRFAELDENNNRLTTTFVVAPIPNTPADLAITSVSYDSAHSLPNAGENVRFRALVKNLGGTSTPVGVMHRVLFSVDGVVVSWSDTFTGPIAFNQEVLLTANAGPNGKPDWLSTNGNHNVLAWVDDIGVIPESDESNNQRTMSLNVDPQIISGGWALGDIGNVGVAGSTNFQNFPAHVTMQGSGTDIWDTEDAFQFAREAITGDCTIVARVDSVAMTDVWAKAGVMMREAPGGFGANVPDAKHAMMLISAGSGASFQVRRETGGFCDFTATSGAASGWIKLVRQGDTFTGYVWSDGVNWTLVGSDTVAMAATIQIGLAVTSHNNSIATTAEFSSIAITSQ